MNMKSKYKTLGEWKKDNPKDYTSAQKRGYLLPLCEKMGWEYKEVITKPSGYWNNKENVLNSAKAYQTRGEWIGNNTTAYNWSKKNGWYDECVAHMVTSQVPKGYWNVKENILNEAKKYKTRVDWRNKSSGSYSAALRRGLLGEASQHMVRNKKPDGYWTKERCIQEAKKYNTVVMWNKKSSGSRDAAQRKKWMKECTKHMVRTDKPDGYWTKERCIQEASKYEKRGCWRKYHQTTYYKAKKHGWFEEAVKHMKNRYESNG